MTLAHLIPSNKGAGEFVAALERAAADGRPVDLEMLSGGRKQRFSARIISVHPEEDRCLARLGAEKVPRSYWIRYLFCVKDADGVETGNAPAQVLHRETLEKREDRAADGLRALVDTNFVPEAALVTGSLAGKTTGSINGRPCEFYVFRGKGQPRSVAVVFGKTEQAAVRCMQLLDSGNSTWDVFASYLQAHFVWPAWLNLRQEARARAAEVRDGVQPLPSGAGWELRDEREALYRSNGLGFEDLGATASIYSLEGEEPDLASVFDLADRVPAPLLNMYLTVSFDSVQYFDAIERVDETTLRSFIKHGLAAERTPPTALQALDTMAIAQLRELVDLAATGFKARDGAAIREHLRTRMSTMLEREAVRRARYKKYQLLPPPNWNWEQFQFFRSDYRSMLEALHQWMFNGWAPPAAAKRFSALA
ncbi:MAG: hypothetical protein E6R08_00985 [Nevskiaceae bacterium]|nr:MAG: hypothetical protein E6R08_00985 [Nevskiaceae bacterium]